MATFCSGADEGDRTLVPSLGSLYSTTELHPHELLVQYINKAIFCKGELLPWTVSNSCGKYRFACVILVMAADLLRNEFVLNAF